MLVREAQTLILRIRPRTDGDRPPPLRTKAHDFFYDRPYPLEPKVTGPELRVLLEALARRVAANEAQDG